MFHRQNDFYLLLQSKIFREMSFTSFSEDSICLMLSQTFLISYQTDFHEKFAQNFPIRSYRKNMKRGLGYKLTHVLNLMSWIPPIQRNLIKIWKWLHGTQDQPQIMSIAPNNSQEKYDNYLISNAITFSETFEESWKMMRVERGDYAKKCFIENSCTVWHTTSHIIHNQEGEFAVGASAEWFERGRDWNNEKLHSLFFCVSLPSFKTPP